MTKPNSFQTREEWLHFVMNEMRPVFKQHGSPLPAKIRLSVGFTSNGYRGKAIGECWSEKASGDKHAEIFIKPDQDNQIRVAGILVHELVHAAVGTEHGHKLPFKRVAVKMGFEGKMTATTEGAVFKEMIAPILKRAGPLPHKKLSAFRTKKKQTTRLLKAYCATCDYTVRAAMKWLQLGTPFCGHVKQHGRMVCDDLGDGDEDGEE